MATAVQIPPLLAAPQRPDATAASAAGEQRFVLDHVPWPSYIKMGEGIGERRIRVTYDRGALELMTLSPQHEAWKHILGRVIVAIAEEFGKDIVGFGSMTIQREDTERGFEPDECYYIQHEPQVRGRHDLDFANDPPPDLAIEVEVSRSVLDRIGAYAAIKVPELWRFDGERLAVLLLNQRGQYEPSDGSGCFPTLDLSEIRRLVLRHAELGDSGVVRAVRQYVRTLAQSPASGGPASPPA